MHTFRRINEAIKICVQCLCKHNPIYLIRENYHEAGYVLCLGFIKFSFFIFCPVQHWQCQVDVEPWPHLDEAVWVIIPTFRHQFSVCTESTIHSYPHCASWVSTRVIPVTSFIFPFTFVPSFWAAERRNVPW